MAPAPHQKAKRHVVEGPDADDVTSQYRQLWAVEAVGAAVRVLLEPRSAGHCFGEQPEEVRLVRLSLATKVIFRYYAI